MSTVKLQNQIIERGLTTKKYKTRIIKIIFDLNFRPTLRLPLVLLINEIEYCSQTNKLLETKKKLIYVQISTYR